METKDNPASFKVVVKRVDKSQGDSALTFWQGFTSRGLTAEKDPSSEATPAHFEQVLKKYFGRELKYKAIEFRRR